jgi:hypothetical protein
MGGFPGSPVGPTQRHWATFLCAHFHAMTLPDFILIGVLVGAMLCTVASLASFRDLVAFFRFPGKNAAAD